MIISFSTKKIGINYTQAAGQNMSKMPSPIISTMLQWWISSVSGIGQNWVQSSTLHLLLDLDYMKMCFKAIYIVVITIYYGSINSTNIKAKNKTRYSTHRNKYSEINLVKLPLPSLNLTGLPQRWRPAAMQKPLRSPPACCSSAPICRLVKHEHYVCCDCITPAARPAPLCSAAVWRFKDLGPGVKKHVYNPP